MIIHVLQKIVEKEEAFYYKLPKALIVFLTRKTKILWSNTTKDLKVIKTRAKSVFWDCDLDVRDFQSETGTAAMAHEQWKHRSVVTAEDIEKI